MSYLLSILSPALSDKTPTFVHIAASTSGSIPAGVADWSLSVVGTAATIDGVAVTTGTRLSGTGPTSTAIAIVAGSTTTVDLSYSTYAADNDNP